MYASKLKICSQKISTLYLDVKMIPKESWISLWFSGMFVKVLLVTNLEIKYTRILRKELIKNQIKFTFHYFYNR